LDCTLCDCGGWEQRELAQNGFDAVHLCPEGSEFTQTFMGKGLVNPNRCFSVVVLVAVLVVVVVY